jgi:hypothetical protein
MQKVSGCNNTEQVQGVWRKKLLNSSVKWLAGWIEAGENNFFVEKIISQ